MNGKARMEELLTRKQSDRTGFWLGNPHHDTLPGYLAHFGAKDELSLGAKLGDDFGWCMMESVAWRHPEGKPIFDPLGGAARTSLSQDGIFAECDDPRAVDAYEGWPDPKYIDLDLMEARVDAVNALGMAPMGGAWGCFFHVVADYFGMQNYFIKMHTDPDVVRAVTERVMAFYLEANRLILTRMAPKMTGIFVGNDFGTQNDLIISPDSFRTFVLPYFKQLIDQAKGFGLKAMLHSCGAIKKVIPDLIDAGVDALHPLQARAHDMDAQSLSEYKGKLLFVGGIDTQQLLPFGTPAQVRDEVRRVRDILGPGLVVSPSHEALLPNVPPENVAAMVEAAME